MNPLEEEEEGEEERPLRRDDTDPATFNWHPKTVKVVHFLKREMEKGPVTFKKISKGIKRKTAASCFFEILQLKTWDYIELKQVRGEYVIDILSSLRP